MNICDDIERPPYCIRCELPMLKGLAKGDDGLHKSWTCSCGYVLERTGTMRIELPGGAIFVGHYE